MLLHMTECLKTLYKSTRRALDGLFKYQKKFLFQQKQKKRILNKQKMSVLHCENLEGYQKFIASGATIVDFSATWCPPCKFMAPLFEGHAKNHPNIKFVHVDIDEVMDTMEDELSDVSAVPTFKLYKDGKCVKRFSGANPKLLEEWIKEVEEEASKQKEPEKPAEPEKPKEEEAKSAEAEKPKEEEAKPTEAENPKEEEAKPAEAEKSTEEEAKPAEAEKPKEEDISATAAIAAATVNVAVTAAAVAVINEQETKTE